MQLSAWAYFIAFIVAYRVGSYEKLNDEMVKLRKMQLTLKRFRHRIDKFRRRTWNERLEKFDTMMGTLDAFFEAQQA